MNGTLTVEQAAGILNVNPETIRRWLRKGKMAGVKPGGGRNSQWFIQRETVEAITGTINPQGKEQGQ